jgi:lipopolysaccharide transport system permease protein
VTWRYVEAREIDAPLPRRLGSVWRHRRLLQRMAERDLRQRYAGSTLGFAWAVLNPLLFVAIYALIFTFVFGGRLSPGAPTAQYALYVVSGLLPWIAFSEVATKASQAMAEHRSLVKYVVFPIQILPLASLYATAFSQLVGLAAIILLAALVRGGLDGAVLLLPLVLLMQIIFLAGVAWLLGALGAVFRDVKELLQVGLTIGMFLTPIFYVEALLPRLLRLLIALNPLTHLVRMYRDVLMGGGVQHPESFAIFGAVALLLLPAGFLVFERTRVFLSDIL